MATRSAKSREVQLTDWQLFTNNGNFNNPVPPNRRLKRRDSYFIARIDTDSIRTRCRTARSRNQSAITTTTNRILSARSIYYRRQPRIKPARLNRSEEYVEVPVYRTTKLPTSRISTASSQRSQIWEPQAWSFSYLHRAIISIDQQAKKDYDAGRTMHAISAWQNALVFCQQLSQRTQLWPENKAELDEQILALKRTYKKYMLEMMKKNKNDQQEISFFMPTRKCTMCRTEQSLDQFHERFSNSCQHVERTICNRCIYKDAQSRLKGNSLNELTCPEPNCPVTFDSKQIRDIMNNIEKTEATEDRTNRAKDDVDRKGEFIWCAHEECGSGQFFIFTPNSPPIVSCILCKRQTCAFHHVKWHKGLTCQEYDEQQEVLAKAQNRCPKCKSINEKNAKSYHVTCSKCKYEFCSDCRKDYKEIEEIGPKHHKTTCIYYKNKSKSSTCTIL